MIDGLTNGSQSRGKVAGVLTAITLVALLLWIFGRTVHVFLLFFIAVILSLYLGAVRDQLVRRVGVPARLAFLSAVLLTLLVVGGILWLLVPAVVGQTRQLVTVLPDYIAGLEQKLDEFVVRLPGMRDYWRTGQHQVLRALYDQVSAYAESAVPRVFSVVGIAIDVFSVFVMSIYLALQPGV